MEKSNQTKKQETVVSEKFEKQVALLNRFKKWTKNSQFFKAICRGAFREFVVMLIKSIIDKSDWGDGGGAAVVTELIFN